jgi:hypothetical protein
VIGKERETSRLREAQLRAESAETLARAERERMTNVELLSDIGKEITACSTSTPSFRTSV